MKKSILLCIVLLFTQGIAQQRDKFNNLHGPGNVVLDGKRNTMFGAFNKVKGWDNYFRGNMNFADGDRNQIVGQLNKVFGSDSFIRGSLNKIKGNSNQVNGKQNKVSGNGNIVQGSGNTVTELTDQQIEQLMNDN